MTVLACTIDRDQEGNAQEILLAADSQRTYGATKTAAVKLHFSREEKLALASTGYVSEITHMRAYLSRNPITKDLDEMVVYDFFTAFYKSLKDLTGDWPKYMNDWLIVKDMRVFSCCQLAIGEHRNCVALGSGTDYAYGAIGVGGDAEAAVRAACKFDIYCSAPVQLAKITKDKISVSSRS